MFSYVALKLRQENQDRATHLAWRYLVAMDSIRTHGVSFTITLDTTPQSPVPGFQDAPVDYIDFDEAMSDLTSDGERVLLARRLRVVTAQHDTSVAAKILVVYRFVTRDGTFSFVQPTIHHVDPNAF